ncbi:TlpA family protein disulfide reductase [Tenuifilum thalassicum]|uniref:TlpA family protein disulfide reductase n=1 Tax=Tenuifilum thalassicum TaxID=2590900 RepID=A0A7D3XW46_9BACT|nr:TlpA disulfide reductase family protein [Tenuifilum thalassicum]QKG80368.1 TlpA family protein disulfide reductase [Tenuifilum thalassicum]
MNIKIFATIASALILNIGLAQTTIIINVKQSIGTKAKLYSYHGKENVAVDSCRPSANGKYQFVLDKNAPKGIYKIVIGKGRSFDFIVSNDSAIVFETYSFAVEDSLKVISSNNNKVFIGFQKLKQRTEQQLWHIESLKKYYEPSSMFYQMLNNEQKNIELNRYLKGKELASKANDNLVTSAILLDITPMVTTSTEECATQKEQADAWWKGIDLTNPNIVNLPTFIPRVWDYLELLLCEGAYTMEEQDSLIAAYLNKLLELPAHDLVKEKVINSLCNGFADTDYFKVIETLMHYKKANTCQAFSNIEFRTRQMLESELLSGKKAYDFKVKLTGERKRFKLSKTNSKYTLVVFWSVWCPHCIESVPEIYQIYKNFANKGFDVVAICIDEEKDAYLDFITKNNLNWKNALVPYDESNKIILGYNVDETPKMFLIDNQVNIVSRPSTPIQVKVFLEKHLK